MFLFFREAPDISLSRLNRLPAIVFARDVVPYKHIARFVTSDLHRDRFGDPASDYVRDGGVSKIMNEHSGDTCFQATNVPLVEYRLLASERLRNSAGK